jgi:ABC-2 type transport system permease protein
MIRRLGRFRPSLPALTGWSAVFRRELLSTLTTPVALVFVLVFLLTTAAFTFYLGDFFQRGSAELAAFFMFHPWLFLLLGPALAMRLWSEERRSGTLELLLTLPITPAAAVVGKFLAAWALAVAALALTTPLWITVNWLGDPDNGVILISYIGSALMLGAYVAIGSCLSAASSNQVVAFVLAVAVCFLFLVAGLPLVLDSIQGWMPQPLVNIIASFSFLTRFQALSQGVLDVRDLLYFLLVIGVWLAATVVLVGRDRERGL